MKKIKGFPTYGLYSTKKKCLMEMSFYGTDSDYSTSVVVDLSEYISGGILWTTPDIEIAKKIVEKGSTKWYNSCHTSPEWDEKEYGKLEVVELTP